MKGFLIFIFIFILAMFLIGGVFTLNLLNIPIFPKDYSIITFLASIFNLLFGGSIIFGIIKWKIEQEDKRIGIFLDKIDILFENLNSCENFGNKIKINSFKNINFKNGILDVKILGESFMNIENENVDKKILNVIFELISLLNINKELLLKNRNIYIKNILLSKLVIIGNIRYYFYLFILDKIFNNAYFDGCKKGELIIKDENHIKIIKNWIYLLEILDNLNE
ncbi:MAG: hypothetical protein PHR68_02680 [Candidatus Gracilibacteria bacterium]|nr:hypothetical protein [Candidatus Gracilibacteria bacterium]